MAAIRVYDWKGSAEELAELLQKGIKISSADWNARGTYVKVSYEEKGSHTGRPPKYTAEQLQAMYDAYLTTDKTMSEIASEYRCSRPYVSKVVNRIASANGIDLEAERAKYYGKLKEQ